jgi:alkyldihydroxyacetonephosphate synthase
VSESRGFQPDWRDTVPADGTYRQVFKWGAPDRFKHPNRGFFALLKEELGLADADFRQKSSEGNDTVRVDLPSRLSGDQIGKLKEVVGAENVSEDDFSRVKYSTGKTMEEILKLRQGIVESVADLAVHPRDTEDVRGVVAYCNEQRIPITVYGGGSSVTLGLSCTEGGAALPW